MGHVGSIPEMEAWGPEWRSEGQEESIPEMEAWGPGWGMTIRS